MKRNILEIIGFFSVIASLVFVGMEIRQNTTAVRGVRIRLSPDQVSELLLTIATDRNLAVLVTNMKMRQEKILIQLMTCNCL